MCGVRHARYTTPNNLSLTRIYVEGKTGDLVFVTEKKGTTSGFVSFDLTHRLRYTHELLTKPRRPAVTL